MTAPGVDELARIPVDPRRAVVYEHGWQSWSPTCAHRLDERPARPVSDARRVGNYRPDRDWPGEVYAGEGLLAVDPGTGEGVHVFGARSPDGPIPSVRAVPDGDVLVVGSDAPVDHVVVEGGLEHALARWGDSFADAAGVRAVRPAPTVWCSWYHYFTRVTQDDVLENLAAIEDLGLGIDVVQIDDGYQAEIGDWLALSDRFDSLEDIVGRIVASGRRAGIWVAPFYVGERSRLVREHPDWLIGGADPGTGWDQRLHALDVTHPGAEAYLREVFTTLRATGIDYFKIDFLFAGAMEGRRAG
jgi:alpha-galactosidase